MLESMLFAWEVSAAVLGIFLSTCRIYEETATHTTQVFYEDILLQYVEKKKMMSLLFLALLSSPQIRGKRGVCRYGLHKVWRICVRK